MKSPEKIQVREKDWYQQVEHMQVPKGTGPRLIIMADCFCFWYVIDIARNWR